jgi:hypothetical protein
MAVADSTETARVLEDAGTTEDTDDVVVDGCSGAVVLPNIVPGNTNTRSVWLLLMLCRK